MFVSFSAPPVYPHLSSVQAASNAAGAVSRSQDMQGSGEAWGRGTVVAPQSPRPLPPPLAFGQLTLSRS